MKTKNLKNLLVMGFFVVMCLALVVTLSGGVFAASPFNITSPLNNSIHTGTLTVVCGYSNTTDGIENPLADESYISTNRTGAWAKETSGSFARTNSTITITLDVSANDVSGVGLNCTVGNTSDTTQQSSSDGGAEAVHMNLTFDGVAPTISKFDIMLAGQSQSYNRPIDYMCSSISDGADNTLLKILNVTHPSGDTTTFTSLIVDTPETTQFTDTDYPGDYNFTCFAKDTAGNTYSRSAIVTVDSMGRAKVVSATKGIAGNTSTLLIIGILCLVIYFGVIRKKR